MPPTLDQITECTKNTSPFDLPQKQTFHVESGVLLSCLLPPEQYKLKLTPIPCHDNVT